MSYINMHNTPQPQPPTTEGRHNSKHKGIVVGALAAVALLVTPASALAFKFPLAASDGAHADDFGHAVDVDGDVAVVGAPENGWKGAVYVYQRQQDSSWKQTGKLTASDGASGDRLGESVAIDGDVIVAGASGTGYDRGTVYTFSRTGPAQRSETAQLVAGDGKDGDKLGASVDIDGDKIVAGAPKVAPSGVSVGAVYTFTRVGAPKRLNNGKLIASDAASFTRLGRSVAIDGDTIVAGAMNGHESRGAVYTFARNGRFVRTQTAKLTASDSQEADTLGFSVAIEGDTIVAGAPEFRPTGVGAAYTFARVGAPARTETAKLTASDGVSFDHLGWSVAIAGDTIISGAPDTDSGGGSVYKFARVGAAKRTQTSTVIMLPQMPGDYFGKAVAMSGTTLLGGAPRRRGASNVMTGAAVIYEP